MEMDGLGEALAALAAALQKVQELMPQDAAAEQADGLDESTEEVLADGDTDMPLKSSVSDDDDEVSKSLAVASLQKMMG